MLDSLRNWKDSIGAKFAQSANRVNTFFNNGVEEVNNAIQKANNLIAQRVPVQSHGKEINDLIVR